MSDDIEYIRNDEGDLVLDSYGDAYVWDNESQEYGTVDELGDYYPIEESGEPQGLSPEVRGQAVLDWLAQNEDVSQWILESTIPPEAGGGAEPERPATVHDAVDDLMDDLKEASG